MGADRGCYPAFLCAAVGVCALVGSMSVAAAEPVSDFASEEGSVWTLDTLTGDWGGLRGTLAERGVTVELTNTADVMGVVSGGIRRRTDYLSDLDLSLTVETEPLFGWSGGTLYVSGLGLLNTGSPSENAGDIQTLDNIDAPEEWKLYEAWLQQEIFDGRLSLLAGIYDVAGEFDVIETAALFVNSSFGTGKDISQSGENGPSIFPSTALGVRLGAQPVPNGYVRAAILDGVTGDPENEHPGQGFFDLGSDDGVFCVGEAGYVAGAEGEGASPYTKIGLGGWYYSADVDRIGSVDVDGDPRRRGGNYGMYLLAERAVYRETESPERGLSVFARAGFADLEVNPIGYFVGAGGVYTGMLRQRPEDRLGLGVAVAVAGHDFEAASEAEAGSVDGAEVTFELTYRMELTPWLSVQPDLQYVVNPGLDESVDDALVVGARVELAF